MSTISYSSVSPFKEKTKSHVVLKRNLHITLKKSLCVGRFITGVCYRVIIRSFIIGQTSATWGNPWTVDGADVRVPIS